MISVVICSANDKKFVAVSKHLSLLLKNEPHETIRIPDARSLSEGYTRGFKQSRGELLVFCHDDIEILTLDLATPLKTHLAEYDLIGVAGTTRLINGSWCGAGLPYLFGQIAHPHSPAGFVIEIYGVHGRASAHIQALDGMFLAARREVIGAVGFDSATFDGFHHYDLDLSFSAYLAGFRLAVVNDLPIIHASAGKRDEVWKRYCERFVAKHGQHLSSQPERTYTTGWVYVQTKAEVVEVMEETYRSSLR